MCDLCDAKIGDGMALEELLRVPVGHPVFRLQQPGVWGQLRLRLDAERQQYVLEGRRYANLDPSRGVGVMLSQEAVDGLASDICAVGSFLAAILDASESDRAWTIYPKGEVARGVGHHAESIQRALRALGWDEATAQLAVRVRPG